MTPLGPGGVWDRIVYVIDLSPVACDDRRSSCTGCNGLPVYVGQTARTADERFQQHLDGYKSSRWVRCYGESVNVERPAGYGPYATVRESEAAELELAQALRSAGYCVYGAPEADA